MGENEKYTKYFQNFLIENNDRDKATWDNLFAKLLIYPKLITEWNNNDLNNYIKSLNSISDNTIVKYTQYIKKFYEFCCEKEGIKPLNLFLIRDKKFYIDYDKLLSVMLDEQHYMLLKNSLSEVIEGKEYNTRDKLLVELAWEGLSVDEIKNLKERDIKFDVVNDKNVVILNLKERNVIIYDEEIVEDIKKTLNQTEYLMTFKNKSPQFRKYKETDYLIKGVQTNVSNKSTIANPSNVLKRALMKVYIVPDIDLDKLTLEDIRRSRIIDMFKKNASIEDVQEFLGKKVSCDLYWIQEFALRLKRLEENRGD